MSIGKVHSGITIGTSLGIGAGYGLAYFLYPAQLLSVVLGCLAGVMLTPDHDVDGGNITYHYVRKTIGSIPATIWSVFWLPYTRAFKHRSALSHTPILGTIIRLLYIFFPVLVNFARDQEGEKVTILWVTFVSQIMAIPFLFVIGWITSLNMSIILSFVAGLIIADTLHWIADF